MFGVSHIPVRESLKTLTGEGLVQHRPNVGYAVAQLTASELAEMYIVRETLESAAMAAAIHHRHRRRPRPSPSVHRNLEQALKFDDAAGLSPAEPRVPHGAERPSRMLRLVHMLESAWNITEPVQLMVHVEHVRSAPCCTRTTSTCWTAFLDRDADELLVSQRRFTTSGSTPSCRPCRPDSGRDQPAM